MKIRDNRYFKAGVTALVVTCCTLLFFYFLFFGSRFRAALKVVFRVVSPVIVGLAIAYLLSPLLARIEKRLVIPLLSHIKFSKEKTRERAVRVIGVVLTAVLFLSVIIILSAVVVSQIVPSIQNLAGNFENYFQDFSAWLDNIWSGNEKLQTLVMPLLNKLSSTLENWLTDTAELLGKSGDFLKTVSLSVIGFFKGVWNFAVGFIIAIYVLFEKEKFAAGAKKTVCSLCNPDMATSVFDAIRFVNKTYLGFIGGKLVDSLIIGVICFIGTLIMKTPYAALISVVIGATNIIPVFGPFIGAVPSVLLILLADLSHPLNCLWFIIFIIVLQQVDGNIIGPKILGSSTGLSGFWVIFSITVFGGLFGIPGMIVGVPTFAVLYAGVKVLINRRLAKKNMPVDTRVYSDVEAVNADGSLCHGSASKEN